MVNQNNNIVNLGKKINLKFLNFLSLIVSYHFTTTLFELSQGFSVTNTTQLDDCNYEWTATEKWLQIIDFVKKDFSLNIRGSTMAAKVETLSGSSDSSSDESSTNSDSTDSSAESDIENSDNDDNVEIRTKKSKNDRKSFEKSTKNPTDEAKKYNQRYSLLIERINAINQVNYYTVREQLLFIV